MKILVIFALSLFIISCSDSTNDSKKTSDNESTTNTNIPSFEKYKKESKKVDFRQAALGKYEVNSLFEISGEVRRQWEYGNIVVSLDKDGIGKYIVVKFDSKPDLLINDKVKIFARYEKLTSDSPPAPEFIADYYNGPDDAGNFPKNSTAKSELNNNNSTSPAAKIDSITLTLEYSANPFEFRKKRLGKTFESSFRYIGFNDYSGRARIFDEGGFYCFLNPNKFSSLKLTRGDQIIIKGVLTEDSRSIGFNNCQFAKRDDS